MRFTPSTLLTHLMLCSMLLLLVWLLFSNPKRLSRFGIVSLLVCSMLLVVRLALPFEWFFTKTIAVSGFYPRIVHLLKQPIWQLGQYAPTLFDALVMLSLSASVIRSARLIHAQRRYTSYVWSLTLAGHVSYTNIFGKTVDVPYAIDPESSNAYVIGLIKPIIVMPGVPLEQNEFQMILKHELSHVKSYDIFLKYVVELVCILFWWLPFVSFTKRLLAIALEYRADNATTKGFNDSEKTDYLTCLLKVAKSNMREERFIAIGFAGKKSGTLLSRFERVANGSKKASLLNVCILLVVVISMFSTMFVFEPYNVSDEVIVTSFKIDASVSFFVQREDGGYDFYVEGDKVAQTSEIPIKFSAYPVFQSLEEAQP